METSTTFHFSAFQNRLAKMWKHYHKIARKQGITCFRFYDHDMPEFPFAIDWYEGLLHAAEYKRRHSMDEEAHASWLQTCMQIMAEVTEIHTSQVFIKIRKRKAGRTDQYERVGSAKTEHIVQEGGLNFIVNLSDYLDTGLFLDHRITRGLVRTESMHKNVLNLFCYTGSFSVYAADGNAHTVTSVDLSRTYINWAKRNMQYNKLYHPEKHRFIQEDVLEWLHTAPSDAYDLIICDPPTFSNSKRMKEEFEIQRDHVWLLNQLLRCCTQRGVIYFSNNYRNFELNREDIHGAEIKDITGKTTPFDFQGKLHRVCFRLEKL